MFRVAEHSNDGTDMEPKFKMFLTCPGRSVTKNGRLIVSCGPILAMIKFHRGAWGVAWQIFSNKPSYTGQPAGVHIEGADISQDMFLYGKLLPKKYSHCIGQQKKEEGVFKVKSVSGGKSCFGPCASTRRVVKLFTKEGMVKLTRDQVNETLSIAAGENILEAISLAYSLDRLYKMLGSKSEKKARPTSAQTAGSMFGLVGVAVAASIDKGSKKIQRGTIYVEDDKIVVFDLL